MRIQISRPGSRPGRSTPQSQGDMGHPYPTSAGGTDTRSRDVQCAIDSKLRACDLTAVKVDDVAMSGRVKSRAIVIQKKTGRPVQFEIAEQTRDTVARWIDTAGLRHGGFLFPSRICDGRPICTRQYARLVSRWISPLGLDPTRYGTHSLRRTKPTLIYRRTGNLRAVQLLLGHTKLDYIPRRTMSRRVVTRLRATGRIPMFWLHSGPTTALMPICGAPRAQSR
jgi:integrase